MAKKGLKFKKYPKDFKIRIVKLEKLVCDVTQLKV
jgi:transposase-like protein